MARPWDRSDLVRRVRIALDMAAETVDVVGREGDPAGPTAADGRQAERPAPALNPEKVVAETAMLLLCASPLRYLDAGIDDRIEALTAPADRRAPGAARCSPRSAATRAALASMPSRTPS